jgi:site-specific DNA-methyltransferase (adenine-specific)
MLEKALFSSKSDEWGTPQALYDELNRRYHFELDPCATDSNHKCERYFTKEQDGLSQSWGGYRVFCNPPYGRQIGQWVKKCAEHGKEHLAVMLIPVRTDTQWFHEYIYNKPNVDIEFIKRRIRFSNTSCDAPFPSMVVIFDGRKP